MANYSNNTLDPTALNGVPTQALAPNGIPLQIPEPNAVPLQTPEPNAIPLQIPSPNAVPLQTQSLNVQTPGLNSVPLQTPGINSIPLQTPGLNGVPVQAPSSNGVLIQAPGLNEIPVQAPAHTALPMFVTQQGVAADDNSVDLDDLFRDCYFGDFPVPTTATVDAPAPLVSNSEFYSQPQQPQNTNISVKRKASDALDGGGESNEIQSLIPTTSADISPKKDSTIMKPLTDQQKVERRERNRKHAKRSRLRKKFLLESLQEQINGLQSEIESLKDIIKKECPDKAEKLLEAVLGPTGTFTPLPMPSGFGPVKTLMEPDFRLMTALSGSQQNFAISDPSLPDNPIVYVSQGFLDLTGYSLDQVLGRNCRFLQGPGTDQSAVDIIRKGLREGVDTSVCLLNYKLDGTPFWNQFFVAALRDADNNVVNFVGVQCEVSKAVVEKQIAEQKARDT